MIFSKSFFLDLDSFLNSRMRNIPILFTFSLLLAQYDYLLEDINPTSQYYGNNVGTSVFEGKITLHYFGHYT